MSAASASPSRIGIRVSMPTNALDSGRKVSAAESDVNANTRTATELLIGRFHHMSKQVRIIEWMRQIVLEKPGQFQEQFAAPEPAAPGEALWTPTDRFLQLPGGFASGVQAA
jgi:hypothetical protein